MDRVVHHCLTSSLFSPRWLIQPVIERLRSSATWSPASQVCEEGQLPAVSLPGWWDEFLTHVGANAMTQTVAVWRRLAALLSWRHADFGCRCFKAVKQGIAQCFSWSVAQIQVSAWRSRPSAWMSAVGGGPGQTLPRSSITGLWRVAPARPRAPRSIRGDKSDIQKNEPSPR